MFKDLFGNFNGTYASDSINVSFQSASRSSKVIRILFVVRAKSKIMHATKCWNSDSDQYIHTQAPEARNAFVDMLAKLS